MRFFSFLTKLMTSEEKKPDIEEEPITELDSSIYFESIDIQQNIIQQDIGTKMGDTHSQEMTNDEDGGMLISEMDVANAPITYVEVEPVDDYFNVFKASNIFLERIPTMFSHALFKKAEQKNIIPLTQLVVVAANQENIWRDAMPALNDIDVQGILDQRGTIILAMLHEDPLLADSLIERFNCRMLEQVKIDKQDIMIFRYFKEKLLEAFKENKAILYPESTTHIAMVNLANSGDLRKLVSSDLSTEDFVTATSIELNAFENEIVNRVANVYLQQKRGV